jgi:hypothetical protein
MVNKVYRRSFSYHWRPSREVLEGAWELLKKTSRLLKDQLEYLPTSGWFKHSWGHSTCGTRGCSRTTARAIKTTRRHPTRLQSTQGLVVLTSLGPLLRRVPGPTTRWTPETTQLGLHDTCWREARGLQKDSTRLGSCTCLNPCIVLLIVHD